MDDWLNFPEVSHNSLKQIDNSHCHSWLESFDKDMQQQKHNMLLLINNAPSHIFDQNAIKNVRVEFLDPNMTSHIQPMDAGII